MVATAILIERTRIPGTRRPQYNELGFLDWCRAHDTKICMVGLHFPGIAIDYSSRNKFGW